MDLPGMAIPVEYGGSGADHVTRAIMVEEIARVCGSTSLMMASTASSTTPMVNWGSPELKARYLPNRVGRDPGELLPLEVDAGSDVAAMSTRAVRDGDAYVLNGRKHWITNAGISDFYVVFAKTDPPPAPGACVLRGREGRRLADRQAGAQDGHPRQPDRRGDPRRRTGPGRQPIGEEGHGFTTPCTPSTAAARSPPRPWASPRALSTTPPAIRRSGRRSGTHLGVPGPAVHARRYGHEDRGGPRLATGPAPSSTRATPKACSTRPAPWRSASPATSPWRSPPTPCNCSAE